MAKATPAVSATAPKRTGVNWVWLAAVPVFLGAILAYVPSWRERVLDLARPQHPVVAIRQGTIIGRMVDDGTFPEPLEGFMGIPYALPPVDDLRFRPAVPVPSSNETIKAFYLGPRYARETLRLPGETSV